MTFEALLDAVRDGRVTHTHRRLSCWGALGPLWSDFTAIPGEVCATPCHVPLRGRSTDYYLAS